MHHPHQMTFILGCILLLGVVMLGGGCSTSEQTAGNSGATDDATRSATLDASALPPPGAVLRAAGGEPPFRAIGRLALNGSPPFAQPVLVMADGAVYQLTGPARGKCVQGAGRWVDLSGVRVGVSSSPGVRGVVRVTGFQEVE